MNNRHGFWRIFIDEHEAGDPQPKYLERVEDYHGQKSFTLACTQRLDCTAAEQTKSVNAWCELFRNEQLAIDKLWVTTRISQTILDAICCQKELNGLWIKWGVYNDISGLANISNLEYLHLGGGASLENIDVLSKLTKLKAFESYKLLSIHDYSLLAGLPNLIDLEISGDPFSSMQRVILHSLGFLRDMPGLVRLSLCMTRIEDHSYAPIADLPNLRFLDLPRDKDLDKDMDKFKRFFE